MKSTHFWLALMLFYSTASQAQNLIVAVTPADRLDVNVYQEASSRSPGRAVPTKTLPMPLPILETRNGFHRVDVEGQPGWLSTMQVRVQRDSKASCTANNSKVISTNGTISTPGIGTSACK